MEFKLENLSNKIAVINLNFKNFLIDSNIIKFLNNELYYLFLKYLKFLNFK